MQARRQTGRGGGRRYHAHRIGSSMQHVVHSTHTTPALVAGLFILCSTTNNSIIPCLDSGLLLYMGQCCPNLLVSISFLTLSPYPLNPYPHPPSCNTNPTHTAWHRSETWTWMLKPRQETNAAIYTTEGASEAANKAATIFLFFCWFLHWLVSLSVTFLGCEGTLFSLLRIRVVLSIFNVIQFFVWHTNLCWFYSLTFDCFLWFTNTHPNKKQQTKNFEILIGKNFDDKPAMIHETSTRIREICSPISNELKETRLSWPRY